METRHPFPITSTKMVGCFPFGDSCLFLVFSWGKALRGLKGTKGRGQKTSREASYFIGRSVQEVGKARAGYELGLAGGGGVQCLWPVRDGGSVCSLHPWSVNSQMKTDSHVKVITVFTTLPWIVFPSVTRRLFIHIVNQFMVVTVVKGKQEPSFKIFPLWPFLFFFFFWKRHIPSTVINQDI